MLWEGSDCCWEMESTYYPGTDRPHSLRRLRDNSKMYYVQRDQLGSAVGLTNNSNTTTHQYRYTPWGEYESQSAADYNPVGFTGREYDSESKLYYYRYYRAHYYDPRLGRFLSEDAISLAGGVNLYGFAATIRSCSRGGRPPRRWSGAAACRRADIVTIFRGQRNSVVIANRR